MSLRSSRCHDFTAPTRCLNSKPWRREVFVMREVVAEMERPVLLFSGGKDSIVMLRRRRRRRPGQHPIPGQQWTPGKTTEVLGYGTAVASWAAPDRGERAGGALARVVASRRTACGIGSRRRCCSTRWRSTLRRPLRWCPSRREKARARRGCQLRESLGSGTRRTSGRSCGRLQRAATRRVDRSSRVELDRAGVCHTSPERITCRRSTSRTA